MATTGSYYIFAPTGSIQQQGNRIAGYALNAAGWSGPYPTIATAKASLPGGKDYAGNLTPGSLAQDASSAIPGLSALTSGLSALTSRGLWIRIAEGVLGLLLIVVAIGELAKGTPVGKAAKALPLLAA